MLLCGTRKECLNFGGGLSDWIFFLNHGQARSYINVKYWDKIKCFHRILLLSTVSSDSGCLVRFRDVFRFLDLHLESFCAYLEAIHGLNSRLRTLSRGVGDKPCKWKANDFQSARWNKGGGCQQINTTFNIGSLLSQFVHPAVQPVVVNVKLTETLWEVGLLVDEDLGGDDCPEWLECCHKVGITELLGQMVDEQVVGALSAHRLLHAGAVRGLELSAWELMRRND